MELYRLATARCANDLSGEGARRAGGRWNRVGTAVLYTAASRALATLEVLVHTRLAYVPDDYRMLTLFAPDDSLQSVPLDTLPDGWNSLTPPGSIKQSIDDWIAEGRFLLLKVPWAIVAGESDFLVNPNHPRATEVCVVDNQPYLFDVRLYRH